MEDPGVCLFKVLSLALHPFLDCTQITAFGLWQAATQAYDAQDWLCRHFSAQKWPTSDVCIFLYFFKSANKGSMFYL